MFNAQAAMNYLEDSGFQTKSETKLSDSTVWQNLRAFIEAEFPTLVQVRIGTVYTMVSKGFKRRMVVTKENQKTWVMYEVEGSYRPGVRWMIGKTWCTEENMDRDISQSYSLPAGTKLK